MESKQLALLFFPNIRELMIASWEEFCDFLPITDLEGRNAYVEDKWLALDRTIWVQVEQWEE